MALAAQLGLQPGVTVGEGDREVDLVRPPGLGEHGDAIRERLATPAR